MNAVSAGGIYLQPKVANSQPQCFIEKCNDIVAEFKNGKVRVLEMSVC